MAGRLSHCPWHRIIDRLGIAFHYVVNTKSGAGLEYPRNLAVKPLAVVNVHRDMHGDGAVEMSIAIANGDRTPDLEGRDLRLTGAATKFGRDLNEFWSKVNSSDVRAEPVGEIAGRSA